MKKGRLAILILLSMLVCFAGSANAGPITLKFNYSMPLKKSIALSWHWYADELAKQSNGKVKIQFFPLGGLFKAQETRDNIIAGTADIANLSISTEGPRMPLASISSLPTIEFPNTVEGTMDASRVIVKLVEESPELAAEFRSFKVLALPYLTAYGVFDKEPIYLPSDIKGKKMRAAAMHAEFVRSLGGASVNIVPPQVYMSMKTGVIDGSIMSISQIGDYKLWEVAHYFTDVYMGRSLFAIIMNKESWNDLPPDIQQLMDKLAPGMVKKGAEVMYEETLKGTKDFLANGGEIIKVTEEQKKAWDAAKAPLEKMWLENCREKGLGGPAEDLLKRFKALAASK